MLLELGQTKQITLVPAVPAQTIACQAVEVLSVNDDCNGEVKAVVDIGGNQKVLVLWQGEEYEKIGDWTQKQANDRIKELLLKQ